MAKLWTADPTGSRCCAFPGGLWKTPDDHPPARRDSRDPASATARLPVTAQPLKSLNRYAGPRAFVNSVAKGAWHGANSPGFPIPSVLPPIAKKPSRTT